MSSLLLCPLTRDTDAPLMMPRSCCIVNYNLFTFSWTWFERGSLRNGGMLILRIYFAVDGMPIEMYGESWIAGLFTSDDVMLYMAGFETTQGI